LKQKEALDRRASYPQTAFMACELRYCVGRFIRAVTETNRTHSVIFGICNIGHSVLVWQPLIGSALAQGSAAAAAGEWEAAEACFLKAQLPEAALHMLLGARLWERALQLAHRHLPYRVPALQGACLTGCLGVAQMADFPDARGHGRNQAAVQEGQKPRA
jgi:hypothetical protein